MQSGNLDPKATATRKVAAQSDVQLKLAMQRLTDAAGGTP
jgi:hypothetical protein